MKDRRDIVDVEGLPPPEPPPPSPGARRPFLSVWYRCCHTYGRMYRNPDQTEYVGRCPRCGATVRARIGPDGTPRRSFEAR